MPFAGSNQSPSPSRGTPVWVWGGVVVVTDTSRSRRGWMTVSVCNCSGMTTLTPPDKEKFAWRTAGGINFFRTTPRVTKSITLGSVFCRVNTM
jgi:hypothetical protein